ncbi:MAG: VanZ family protein [Atopobiaceae bacterium]|nr:VanZ family protein [Atopobiaceae bacterium]MCI1389317.1 VanZ family protein [Atopobiaceae bacterium]
MRPGWLVALLVWILFVWGHSLVAGPSSDADSLSWVARLAPVLDALGVVGVRARNHVVRKTAHFCEYLVLGLLDHAAMRPAWRRPRSRVLPAVLVAALVPCVDETIQLFVPRRLGSPADVLLDMCGAACGLALAAVVRRLRARRARA